MLEKYHNGKETTKLHAGVDESGRGPLAGPVVIAAVVFDHSTLTEEDYKELEIVSDSKKLSKKKREKAEEIIKRLAKYWSISVQNNDVIDDINILQATLKGMHDCIDQIVKDCKHDKTMIDLILVDGTHFHTYFNPWYDKDDADSLPFLPHECVVKGDSEYLSIASASILAKVEHDRIIQHIIDLNPEYTEKYSWASNMCYGTKAHIEGIKKHGISSYHRRSFCKKWI